MDNGDPRFPYPRYLRVPFIFVPKGNPPPLEWMAAHPGWVKFPATLVPRGPGAPQPDLRWDEPEAAAPPPEEAAPDPRPGHIRRIVPPPGPRHRPIPPSDLKVGNGQRERQGKEIARRLLSPQGRHATIDSAMRRLNAATPSAGSVTPILQRPGAALGIRLASDDGGRDLIRKATRISNSLDRFGGKRPPVAPRPASDPRRGGLTATGSAATSRAAGPQAEAGQEPPARHYPTRRGFFQQLISTLAADPLLLATVIGTEIAGGGPEDPVADAAVAAEIGAADAAEATATNAKAAQSALQAMRARGLQFQRQALDALGIPEKTKRLTVILDDGSSITVVPDAFDGITITEAKDVAKLFRSKQFKGYAAADKVIRLVVSPNTRSISVTFRKLIHDSEGKIVVFDPATGKFTPWPDK